GRVTTGPRGDLTKMKLETDPEIRNRKVLDEASRLRGGASRRLVRFAEKLSVRPLEILRDPSSDRVDVRSGLDPDRDVPGFKRKDRLVLAAVADDHGARAAEIKISPTPPRPEKQRVQEQLFHSVGLRRVAARLLGTLLHLDDCASLVDCDVADPGIQRKQFRRLKFHPCLPPSGTREARGRLRG